MPHLPRPHGQPPLSRFLSGPQSFLSFTFNSCSLLNMFPQGNKKNKAFDTVSPWNSGLEAGNLCPVCFSAAQCGRQGWEEGTPEHFGKRGDSLA